MLNKLELENFRNHRALTLKLDNLTVITGPNGAGKTNILEALVLLSFCRSFREEDKKNLINRKESFARIIADNLEAVLLREPRFSMRVKYKGAAKKLADFIGTLPAVVLSPEMIAIINGAPGEKRRFLDVMLVQTDREYLLALSQLKKVRYGRNILLQKIARREGSRQELKFWNEKFLELSSVITTARKEAVLYIEKDIPNIYRTISGNREDDLELEYINNYTGELKEVLEQNLEREIATGNSMFGPHRDDLKFTINSMLAENFASRGELKSILLTLKITELNFLKRYNKKRALVEERLSPLLLLDDVFSEFDAGRREHLLSLISDFQTVITTADKKSLPEKLLDRASIINLK